MTSFWRGTGSREVRHLWRPARGRHLAWMVPAGRPLLTQPSLGRILAVSNPFFERPIVNSPYEYPHQHWELDSSGQPTGNLIDRRRRAEFITPIPKPKKRRGKEKQEELLLEEGL